METYDYSTTIINAIFLLIIILLTLLILRQFFLWYSKINRRLELLEEIRLYLAVLAKKQDPDGFDRVRMEIESRNRDKSTLKRDIELLKKNQGR